MKWPCAIIFSLAGVAGAAIGSTLGKMIDAKPLMLMFAVAMAAVGVSMLRKPKGEGAADVRLNSKIGVKLMGIGLVVGIASGLFGIGGGFLIVPGLMLGSCFWRLHTSRRGPAASASSISAVNERARRGPFAAV